MELDEEIEEQKDDYMMKRNILMRNYQMKLFEQAKKKNSIIYLPTGSGKTLIAIHVLCSRTEDIQRPFSHGGKRAFFITTTKVMVNQMAKVLQTHTKFKVVHLTGDMNVDCWNASKWMKLFENYHVCVLTGEILKTILQLNFISPSQISLLVLDECHHAMLEHPYRLIMKAVNEVDSEETPLILGLSSVLLNITPKINQVEQQIQYLEGCLNAKVITETQFQEVMSFSANPDDKLLVYDKHYSTFIDEYIFQTYDNIINILNNIIVKSQETIIPEYGKDFKNRNKAKRIKNSFVQSRNLFEELGMFGGSVSVLYFIIFFEKLRLLSVDTLEIQILLYANTELLKLRRIFLNWMGEEESVASIINFSSDKVQQLLKTIKEIHDANNGKHLAILIFVRQRVTAVVLSFLLKRLTKVGSEFSFLKPEFVVGTSAFSKESLFLGTQNKEIVRKFARRSLNVIVATNLLEEGIDVSACNVVISFDFPVGYPSYFQSRGRARNKESTYIMLVEKDNAEKRRGSLNHFRDIESEIMRTVSREDRCMEGDEDSNDLSEKIQLPGKFGLISLDGPTAIKIVQRYCFKLPQDKYSFLSPTSWYIRVGEYKQAFVQLPQNCPIRKVIEGELRKTVKEARRNSFLCTVKALYDMGELDQEMNPKSSEMKIENFNYLFPHFKKEKIDKSLPQPGTSRREQKYKMKFAESLSGCLPRPGTKVYLHVINLTVTFDKPLLQRKVVIYEALRCPATFALLSSKKLCKIFQFPLFLDMGQINCDLLVNYDELVLTESEINAIKECHFALFKKVTKVVKNSQVFDNRNKENSFFVVPVEKNENERFVINWDLIRCDYCKAVKFRARKRKMLENILELIRKTEAFSQFLYSALSSLFSDQNSTSALVRYNPSSSRGMKRPLEILEKNSADTCSALLPMNAINGRLLWAINQDDNETKFVMTETDYKYFVIIPNYRNQVYPQHYIVNKFCRDMSPLSPFPNVKYEDYVSYYKGNYMVDITNKTQPLLRVSPIYDCSNFNKPRKRKLWREKNKTYEEHLVPELCDVIPFDRKYFLKALLLPTVLNRICHIYCVEEFRRKIVSESGLGAYELPEGTEWPPLDLSHLGMDEENEDASGSLTIKNKTSALPITKLKDQTQVKEQIILDPERNMYEVGLCDLEFYVRNLKQEEAGEEEVVVELKESDDLLRLSLMRKAPVPPLSSLKSGCSAAGPDLAQLVQACTSRSANDVIDYERLEILGDSFLKFAATLFLFRNFPEQNEGVLTSLKGKMVGNRNLLYCASAKDFPDIINVNDFVPSTDWNPPLFCIPERLVDGIVTRNLDPAVIYRLEIPFEEQFSGVPSEETFERNEEILEGYEKCYEMATNSLLPYKILKDKTVSDCLEAFIGAYLVALGMRGAFDFLSWLQVLPKPAVSCSELLEGPYRHPSDPKNEASVMNLLSQVFYSELEDTLNYRFNNKALLLEAITHPSYSRNRVTDCYQRLELLGDAILDFLITSYVYEYCGNLGPGAVTDIRSSLVNNITFACLTVRYELHKYLLSFSSALSGAINNFVTFQVNRNHVVDDNVLILLEESSYSIAEAVQVPKALGDIFESLAGAIYLDSSNSLETVWKVFYAMMKREIDEFTKTVPKTPVRLLYEICGEKPYFESEVVRDGLVMVSCTVYYDREEIKAYGFGSNKKEAKRSAVKVALNEILLLKK